MKWLIISCALIFYSISLIGAESEEITDQDLKCHQEFMNQSNAESKCVDEHLDRDELVAALNETRGAPIDDPNAVRTLAEKYCPQLNHTIYCFPMSFDVSPECLAAVGVPLKHDEMTFQTEIFAKILAYACENDGAALIRLFPHKGFEAIVNFEKFGSCFNLNKVPFTDPNSATFRVNPLYCDGLSKSADCYVDYLRDHTNQELALFMNEVHALVREMLKCE